jgi:hypothetical protein
LTMARIYIDFTLQEPGDRALSLGVISVEAEEKESIRTNHETDAIRDAPFSTAEEPIPLDDEVSSQVDTNTGPQPSSNPDPELLTGSKESPTSATHVIPDAISSMVENDVPMPVTADANFVDPTSCPDTPSHQRGGLTPAAVDVRPQAQQQASGDGLFTPADGSTTGTPADIHRHVWDELARAFFGTPVVSSTSEEKFSPVLNTDNFSDLGFAIDDRAIEEIIEAPVLLPPIGSEATMHISGAQTSENIQARTLRDGPISPLPSDPHISMLFTPTRKPADPILVSDPYPYSLSTPGVSLADPTDEDSEQDHSMSSNSTLEKDLEDKDTNSILDDADPLELQYPPEPDILVESNGPAAAQGEEASKIAVGNAHGVFDSKSMVTPLPLPIAEVQQPANSPTIDGTVTPGVIVDEVAHGDAHEDFDSKSVVAPLPQPSAEVQRSANLPAIDGTVVPGPINGVEKDTVTPTENLPM